MINVTSTCIKLKSPLDSFSLFESLKSKFIDSELFLLESLSGPDKDVNQAVVGLNPIFGIEFHINKFKLCGSKKIKLEIEKEFLLKKWIIKKGDFEYKLVDIKDIWKTLRLIESLFNVEYIGENKDIGFGYFGFIGYDAIHAIENIPYSIEDDKETPIVSFNIYQGIFNIDLQKGETYLTTNLSALFSGLSHDEILNLVTNNPIKNEVPDNIEAISQINSITDSVSKNDYLQWVEKALYHINLGDIYQIQLGHEITINSDISPYTVYKRLRTLNPSPYMYYTQIGSQHIIGASPELFLRIDLDNNITMRPIAGTVKIGDTPEHTTKLHNELLSDEKERAEHIMLVDLCRNDVGKVCETNTLSVDELMIIEQYSHVSHIVSNVIGIKKSCYDKYDVISATFPAGTMTGAPKIRAMEIIEEIETTRRGIYAGAIGFIGFNGVVETALCIRTAMYNNNVYTIRASGGIVYDSTPTGEWNESISKLSATYFSITNKELKDENFIN